MGHPQPATPVQVDNSTACGIANETIKQRRSKAIDMRFYWVQDRVNQKQFHVYWKPGKENLADYVTKHHTAKHHQEMRYKFLHKINLLQQQLIKTIPTDRTHCEGVLISNPHRALANIKQYDTNPGMTDRRQTDTKQGEPHKLITHVCDFAKAKESRNM